MTTTPVYVSRVSYDIADMREGRAVGTIHTQVTVRHTENTESSAREAFGSWLVSAQVAWANLSTFKSFRVLKTIKA